MFSALATGSTCEGRFARTGLLAVLAGSWGSVVFENANDAILAAPFFVLTILATATLADELHTQARRPSPDGARRWERTDTAIVVILVGLAAISAAGMALRPFTAPEQSAGASFAALYLVLAGFFGWKRRATLARS